MSEYQIFLSYSFKDLLAAERLRATLWHYGLSVYPNKILTPGTKAWHIQLYPVLEQAACVIVILSGDTLGSRWVSLALDYAQEHHMPVVPVVVSGEPGHVLLVRLAGRDWFDLRRNSRYNSEVKSLATLVQTYAMAWAR